jgi:hypothetical protein
VTQKPPVARLESGKHYGVKRDQFGEPGGNRTHNPQIKRTTGGRPPFPCYVFPVGNGHLRCWSVRPPPLAATRRSLYLTGAGRLHLSAAAGGRGGSHGRHQRTTFERERQEAPAIIVSRTFTYTSDFIEILPSIHAKNQVRLSRSLVRRRSFDMMAVQRLRAAHSNRPLAHARRARVVRSLDHRCEADNPRIVLLENR